MGERLLDMLAELPKSFNLGKISKVMRFGVVWRMLSKAEPRSVPMRKVSWRCREGKVFLTPLPPFALDRRSSTGFFRNKSVTPALAIEPARGYDPSQSWLIPSSSQDCFHKR